MSMTMAAVKAVWLLQSQRRPWYLLRFHCRRCNSGCLGSRRIKRAWRVTPREMMTGGVGDGIAIGVRPRHLRR